VTSRPTALAAPAAPSEPLAGRPAGNGVLLEIARAAEADPAVARRPQALDLIVPESLEAPAAALEYARRLAQRDVPLHALVCAYRLGHGRFLRWCLEEMARQVQDGPATVAVTGRMLDLSFRYIDQVSQRVIMAYQQEHDRWLLTQTAARAARVRTLLTEQHSDVDASESALGYPLRQHHLGLVSWIPEPTRGGDGLARLDRLTTALGEALNCRDRPLFVPCDESVAWSWLPLGGHDEVAYDLLPKAVEHHDPRARIAVGEPVPGVGEILAIQSGWVGMAPPDLAAV
jgi:hypothetical protein